MKDRLNNNKGTRILKIESSIKCFSLIEYFSYILQQKRGNNTKP